MGSSKLNPGAVSEHKQSHLFTSFSIFCSTSWPALCCRLPHDTLLRACCKSRSSWRCHLSLSLSGIVIFADHTVPVQTLCVDACSWSRNDKCWECVKEIVVHFNLIWWSFMSASSNETQSAPRMNASLCLYLCHNPLQGQGVSRFSSSFSDVGAGEQQC